MQQPVPRVTSRRRAFTLVELLVVIGVIALLISILIPVLGQARRAAQQVACQSNIRQLGVGFLMFAGDHKGRLPGVQGATGTEPWQADWLGDSASTNPGSNESIPLFNTMPQGGTLWEYMRSKNVYQCPGLADNGLDMASGSNGKFSYQACQLLSGANITKLAGRRCGPYLTQNLLINSYSAVILVEPDSGPDPTYLAAGSNMVSGKTSRIQCYQSIALHHPNGGNFFCIDGSVQSLLRKKNGMDLNNGCWEIECRSSPGYTWNPDYAQLYISQQGWAKFP